MLKCNITCLVYIVSDRAQVGAPIRFNYWVLIKPYTVGLICVMNVYVIRCAICTVI